MFGRRKPAPVVTHPDVHHFRRQLRNIEWSIKTLDPHNAEHLAELTQLANHHADYRRCLRAHGVVAPEPIIEW